MVFSKKGTLIIDWCVYCYVNVLTLLSFVLLHQTFLMHSSSSAVPSHPPSPVTVSKPLDSPSPCQVLPSGYNNVPHGRPMTALCC